MFQLLTQKGFEVLTLHHAAAILLHDMPKAVEEIESVLMNAGLPAEELIRGGGGEGGLTQRLRRSLTDFGWSKHSFEIKKIVDGKERESVSHEVDHVKCFGGFTFALEIEWNNKDPFFDRDLENFKRLHADGVISMGGIITRGESLQNALRSIVTGFAADHAVDSLVDVRRYYSPTDRQCKNINQAVASNGSFHDGWAHAFVADKFGQATTHWRKLMDRVNRGVGNPCPLVLIGIPNTIVHR